MVGYGIEQARTHRALIAAGLAGITAAIAWMIGDMLIVGEQARIDDFPLLLRDYAPRIDFFALHAMLPATEPRLAASALVAALTSSLYLVGAWHLFHVAKPAGGRWSAIVFGLLIFGFANAPLGHAAFYFVAMVYKTIPVVPESAHPALLELGNQFNRVFLFPYIAAVGGIVLGLFTLAILAALGRTLWPRWMALVANPISLAILGNLIPLLTPQPVRTWLGGAGISLGTLVLFVLSTGLVARSQLSTRMENA